VSFSRGKDKPFSDKEQEKDVFFTLPHQIAAIFLPFQRFFIPLQQ
jgi:hypothetical protein